MAPLRHWLAGRASPAWPTSTPPATSEWAAHLARLPAANRTRGQALDAVSTLWGYRAAPAARRPHPDAAVGSRGTRDYLPAEEGRNENATAPSTRR